MDMLKVYLATNCVHKCDNSSEHPSVGIVSGNSCFTQKSLKTNLLRVDLKLVGQKPLKRGLRKKAR